mgnify:CR=1 FL=1
MTVGKKISALRKYLSLTQQQFADDIGYSLMQLSKIERGIEKPGPNFIKLVCEKYGVKKEYFDDTSVSAADESLAVADVNLSATDAEVDMSVTEAFICKPEVRELEPIEIGKRIRELRNEQQMSQRKFADFVHCSRETIIAAENAEYLIGERILEKISHYCDVGMDWLKFGDEKRKYYPVDDKMIEYLWDNEDIRKQLRDGMK